MFNKRCVNFYMKNDKNTFKQRNNLFNQARLRLLFYFAGIAVDSIIDILINYRNYIMQKFVNYILNV